MFLQRGNMKFGKKGILFLAAGILIVLIAAGLSNCEEPPDDFVFKEPTEAEKKSDQYERLIQDITKLFSNRSIDERSIGGLINGFTELGDYKDSPRLLSLFKALEAGEFPQFAELYTAYSAEPESRVTAEQWFYLVESAFRQKYPGSITDPPAYYRDRASWARIFVPSGGDESYTSAICSDRKRHWDLGFGSQDDLVGACGADPKGKLLVIIKSDPIKDYEEGWFSCNTEAMVQLPEALFPYSLEEVEYIAEIRYSYKHTTTYGKDLKGFRKDVEVIVTRLPDKKVLYSSKIPGEGLSSSIWISNTAVHYVGHESQILIERNYGNALAVLAGKTTNGYTYIPKDGAAVIVSYTGSAGNLVMPDNLDGYPVKSISTSAFRGDPFVSVKLPPSLERIGAHAFYGCDRLSSVELPESLLYIGVEAFKYCAVKRVEFPENLESLGESAFEANRNLEKISFLGSLKTIPDRAFYDCEKLYEVKLSEGLEEIGFHAFHFTALANLVIPDGVVVIGPNAFSYCNRLVTVKLPASIKTIAIDAFCGCGMLKNIQFPEGLEVIGENAFEGCDSLEEIILPSTLKSLGRRAFTDCSGIKEIRMPENLEEFSSDVFEGCASIRDIYFLGRNKNLLIQASESVENSKVTIHCAKDSSAYELVEKYGYSWSDAMPGN
jgi:hypothetical protein